MGKSLEKQDWFDGLEARLAALYFNEPSTEACLRDRWGLMQGGNSSCAAR